MYKFFNRSDLPWVNLIWNAYYNDGSIPSFPTKQGSFWWRDCCHMLRDFKSMTSCVIKAGTSAQLWKDKWGDRTLDMIFPQLFSFAKNKDILVTEAVESANIDFYDMFHLPMSTIAVQ